MGAQVLCRIALPRDSLCPLSTQGTVRTSLSDSLVESLEVAQLLQVAHAVSQGCGLQWCFSSCLTGQCRAQCELGLSFHLWL